VTAIPKTREHPSLAGRETVQLNPATLPAYDAVVIVTDHDNIDYALLAAHAKLVVDTRNAMAGIHGNNIAKA
jgi:UDP-N-acetyl-D-glucosamine dehydrogenase